MSKTIRSSFVLVGALLLLAANAALAANSLVWHRQKDVMDADFSHCTFLQMLGQINKATGWKIAYEAGLNGDVSLKFSNVPESDALHRLLGSYNFAKEITNGVTQLIVFRTTPGAATHALTSAPKDYIIPNELLVKLRRNSPVTIEQLAAQLHAKIVGRDDRNLLYRLQFDDSTAADAAAQSLASNDAVAVVGHNYYVDPPNPQSGLSSGGAPNPAALVNPKTPADGAPVIGLIDTAIQPQPGYDKYILNPISVVGQADAPTDQPAHATAMLETMVQSMGNDPTMVQPVVIYKDGEETTTFELMQGILAAVNNGDNPINLSLGGTGNSPLLEALVEQASEKGVVFVAASGNSGGVTPTYPAAYPNVLSVTATDPATGQLASYADDFSGVKSSASGTSYVPYGGQIWQVQGTSPATASASGAITSLALSQKIPMSTAAQQWSQQNPPPSPSNRQ